MINRLIDFSPGSLARKQIQKEFYSKKWNQFRIWFFETYGENDLKIFPKIFMIFVNYITKLFILFLGL